jgi:hypothetical protein
MALSAYWGFHQGDQQALEQRAHVESTVEAILEFYEVVPGTPSGEELRHIANPTPRSSMWLELSGNRTGRDAGPGEDCNHGTIRSSPARNR